ncbi:MAG TPA: hypothetical protein VLW52_13315 [Opitutaceae bacterium]|nr:hypothetical protein [Opitutaceae bacterium]
MKKCLLMCGLLVFATVARPDTGFLKTLPAEDFAAAGLQKLTPDELARLEALVQQYKKGEMVDVMQQAETKAAAARQEAEKRIVAAESKARAAEAKASEAVITAGKAEAKPAAAPVKKQPGWFTALLTLKRAGEKPDKEAPLESRLVGDFEGWNGRSVFNLENGTRWVQQNRTDTYIYSPRLHSPKVKITPAAIRGYWLEIEGVNLSVRVIPLELPDQK